MTNSDSFTGGNGELGNNPGARNLKDQAKNLAMDAKNKASEFADSVAVVAKDQAGEIATAAKDLATDAAGRVSSALNEQKTAGADYLGSIAQAAQRAAGEFESDVPQAAQYIRKTAGQLESVANAVRDSNMRDLVDEVNDFARRQPALFFGGAMVLGFAALRFLKSSPLTPANAESPISNRDTSYSG